MTEIKKKPGARFNSRFSKKYYFFLKKKSFEKIWLFLRWFQQKSQVTGYSFDCFVKNFVLAFLYAKNHLKTDFSDITEKKFWCQKKKQKRGKEFSLNGGAQEGDGANVLHAFGELHSEYGMWPAKATL